MLLLQQLCQSAQAAAAALPPAGRLINKPFLSRSSGGWKSPSESRQIWCLVRFFFLVHRWRLLPASSRGGGGGGLLGPL